MVHLQLIRRNPESGAEEMLADLTVKNREVQLTGPRTDLIDLDQRVVSVHERRLMTFHEDPEEWTRSLSGSFRTPDLYVSVLHDDKPYTPARTAAIDLREPVYETSGH